MSVTALDRARVAELIVTGAGGHRRGSGYRVTTDAVLTAAHVVRDADTVRVRFEPDLPGEWTAAGLSWWSDPDSDLAVITIAGRPGERLLPASFGRIGGRAASLEVQAVGFPLWKLREDGGEKGGKYRDAYHAVGRVATLSNWRAGTLEVTVSPAPSAPRDGVTSPWEGMSGAALWAGDRIVGVISRHHPGDGLARLAAARVDSALERLDPARRVELGRRLPVPDGDGPLPDVTASGPPRSPEDPEADEAFADRYRDFMAGVLDRFEFFGVDPRGITRRHNFAAGYVPVTLRGPDGGDDTTVSPGARADQALGDHRRVLVRGVAGAGKSTLMRWLGVRLSEAPHADEPPAVPFIVELGRLATGRPPELTEIIAPTLRLSMPEGWTRRMLARGRVLLLLDGLDEVPARERAHLEDWVAEYLQLYPETRCIVSTRPSVVAEQWWFDRGFQRLDLLPMSRHSIEQYVRGWHSVARADQPNTPEGAAIRRELARTEESFLSTLSNRTALRGMSANPLLCGLLCALHLERGEHLPENRKQVYDAALDLLLFRWRHLRRRRRATDPRTVTGSESAHHRPDAPLSDEELLKLFQRLAFWMVINRRLMLSRGDAEKRVASLRYGLRSAEVDPARVLDYLANDSGLLRELENRSLEFVHRTFRDHLAAKEVVEEENLTLLLDQADKPHWHDVVVMAGAHARPAERARILLDLVERGRTEREHRDALHLLAAAILEQASVLPRQSPDVDVRRMVVESIAGLIPPTTPGAADQLAAAGTFVLDLLPGPRSVSDAQAVLVVRALARIAAQWNNPPGAVEKILQFTAAPTPRLLNELLEPWGRLGDYHGYARDVLSQIDFRLFDVALQNRRRIDHIGYLRTIRKLTLRNDMLNLGPLADLPDLRELTLIGNSLTVLDPLARTASLRVLVLDNCSSGAGARAIDLAPLSGADQLRRLVITGLTTKVNLEGLHGVRLDTLQLTAPSGPAVLSPDIRVREVYLSSRARRVRIDGVRDLESVVLDWVPDEDELAALARLPGLRRLVLRRLGPGDVPPTLPGVEVIIKGPSADGS